MGRSQKAKKPCTSGSPASSNSSPSPTSPHPPCCPEVGDILTSIDNKLSGLDARVALIEILHKEFQQLRHSLEYSQQQIDTHAQENSSLQNSVTALTTQLSTVTTQLASVTSENKMMKETILDLQVHSMRDNLIFTGISEPPTDDPEKAVKDFMVKQLKLSTETVNNITFHRVHRLGQKLSNAARPRPIIVKFEHFKKKELVHRQGRQLKDTHYRLNYQFPQEINHRRKQLIPIRKQMIKECKRATLIVDKLYIDGQLFKDKDITPWHTISLNSTISSLNNIIPAIIYCP